ncbi:MAG: sulfide/dihydroorotate dehydrogenase-like FAD/NAD-binding protein [Bdellovibrionota bacterium]
MNKIFFKEQLSLDVYHIKVYAKEIAKNRKAGQFVIVMLNEDYAERIPLTIADANVDEGSISLVFQAIGATTFKLSRLNVGDEILVVGPLGTPTHIENFGKVVCVGGGVGVAPLYPICKALYDAGNEVHVILGARTKDLILFEERFREVSHNLTICTDDGSYGRKGVVTLPLEELCQDEQTKPNLVIAIGPLIMMKFCALTTKKYDVKTVVSLNTIMIDGTGMCGGCRVVVDGQTKFVCVDGPEFDASGVDFDNLLARQSSFKDVEREKDHKCRLEAAVNSNAYNNNSSSNNSSNSSNSNYNNNKSVSNS